MGTIEKLTIALNTKKPVYIIYQEGTSPGVPRLVTPVHIQGDSLRAKCHLKNITEDFWIDRIQIIDVDNGLRETENDSCQSSSESESFASLAELFAKTKDQCIQLGWRVDFEDECITLHSKSESNKFEEKPDISIFYQKYSVETYFQADESLEAGYELVEQQYLCPQPWIVTASEESTFSYNSCEKAAQQFLLFAQKLAPANRYG